MAAEIYVNYPQLKQKEQDLRTYVEDDRAVLQTLTNVVMSVQDEWLGDAQAAFIANFMAAKQQFDSFEESLLSFADIMADTIKEFQNKEQDLLVLINKI